MLSDWEYWAVASQALEQHGSEAPFFVATRIGALAAAGDMTGVSAWKEVARRMTALMGDPPAITS